MACNHKIKRQNVITWHHLQRTKHQNQVKIGLRCHQSFADTSRVKVFWSPSGTFCPKASAGGRHGKSEPRSVGVLANAHGITLLLQRTKHQQPQLQSFADIQSKGLLVSQWHFLPQGTGTFPAAYSGASSLCVCCVAMLVLPPKSCKFNATFQIRKVQAAADMLYC